MREVIAWLHSESGVENWEINTLSIHFFRRKRTTIWTTSYPMPFSFTVCEATAKLRTQARTKTHSTTHWRLQPLWCSFVHAHFIEWLRLRNKLQIRLAKSLSSKINLFLNCTFWIGLILFYIYFFTQNPYECVLFQEVRRFLFYFLVNYISFNHTGIYYVQIVVILIYNWSELLVCLMSYLQCSYRLCFVFFFIFLYVSTMYKHWQFSSTFCWWANPHEKLYMQK